MTSNERVRRARRGSAKRRQITEYISGVDVPFLITIIILLCIGTVMVFSASYPSAKADPKINDSYHYAVRQIIFAVAGLVAMAFVAKFITYDVIRVFAKPVLIVAILLLVAVLIIGEERNGSKRWIDLRVVDFQPSEIVKFALVLFFADYADRYADKIRLADNFKDNWKPFFSCVALICAAAVSFLKITPKWLSVAVAGILAAAAVYFLFSINLKRDLPGFYYGILPYGIVLVIVAGLLYLQPHMSGLIIMAAIIVSMMFIGGTKLYYIIGGGALGAAGLFALLFTQDHSTGRLAVWFDPFEHLKFGGWQPAQSLYAIGSGGFSGVGFGNSRQKHLYLPEPQNDYIFSIFCEEMGFIGALVVLCIFAYFIYRGIRIGLGAPDRFSSMLVIGIVMHVAIQVLLNVAVVTNVLPSTGISLPFFSYGGTALMILLCEMGVVLSVSRHSRIDKTS